MSYSGTPSITSQLAAVGPHDPWRNRRMPAASTAGYQIRSLKFSSSTGPPSRGREHQGAARAPGHQRGHARQDVRRHRHDPVRLLRLRPLPQACPRHHVDDLDLAAQPVHAVAMEPVQLAWPQPDLDAELDQGAPARPDLPRAAIRNVVVADYPARRSHPYE